MEDNKKKITIIYMNNKKELNSVPKSHEELKNNFCDMFGVDLSSINFYFYFLDEEKDQVLIDKEKEHFEEKMNDIIQQLNPEIYLDIQKSKKEDNTSDFSNIKEEISFYPEKDEDNGENDDNISLNDENENGNKKTDEPKQIKEELETNPYQNKDDNKNQLNKEELLLKKDNKIKDLELKEELNNTKSNKQPINNDLIKEKEEEIEALKKKEKDLIKANHDLIEQIEELKKRGNNNNQFEKILEEKNKLIIKR